jgi:hypothetical protein
MKNRIAAHSIRLTESHLRKIIREELLKSTRSYSLLETFDLPPQPKLILDSIEEWEEHALEKGKTHYFDFDFYRLGDEGAANRPTKFLNLTTTLSSHLGPEFEIKDRYRDPDMDMIVLINQISPKSSELNQKWSSIVGERWGAIPYSSNLYPPDQWVWSSFRFYGTLPRLKHLRTLYSDKEFAGGDVDNIGPIKQIPTR